MGTFSVRIEVGDPEGRHFRSMDALVDTGATYMVVPRGTLASLGVQPLESRPFTLADGRTVQYEVGIVSLHIDGKSLPTLCVFGDDGGEVLLGAVVMESFLLAPDPVGQRLVPVPGKLMRQTLF